MAALLFGCFSVVYCLGYRGKYNPSVEPLDFVSSARVILLVIAVSFIVLYPLRLLGVQFDREDKEEARDRRRNKVR